MIIQSTKFEGVKLLSPRMLGDHRGYLVRTYCEETFRKEGLNTQWSQSSVTATPAKGTLRGMHFQTEPHGEVKLLRCLSGAVWDCLVDLRKHSPTYGQWESFQLDEEHGQLLYVPAGIAHGFYTLTDDARMHYSMSVPYSEPHASGVRWDDPKIGISWPGPPILMSERDQNWPHLESAEFDSFS